MRLVIVSNRLPIVIERDENGWKSRAGSGGLVTAVAPVLQRVGGLWIGWPGSGCTDESELERMLVEHGQRVGYELKPVPMSQAEIEGFYQGFCNRIIWPLFHDLQSLCNFKPDYWTNYLSVRGKYAEIVGRHAQPDDFIWVHDYQLLGLGRCLRELGVTNRIGFFLHIPFPPPDIFCKLPWRLEILEGLLHNDIVGFQTPRDLENFLDCIRKLLPDVRRRQRRGVFRCVSDGRTTDFGVFPIGIDYARFAQDAADDAITRRVAELRRDIPGQQIVVGVDRLDYTKGIPDRLRALHLALTRYPELHRKVSLLQVVVPSRESVPEYQELKGRIEQLVAQINGEFTQPGWIPIHYVFRSLEWNELLAYYRAADVALITPLKDGMNLVAKEYCACQIEGNGVLILSEFAGAAVQLKHDAILVNPYDLDRVADAIRRGVLRTPKQRRPAMRRLRSAIQRQDVFWWVERFLSACGVAARCKGLPQAVKTLETGPLGATG
ncbi:MAG: Trehalose-6-phosphate synthase [Phycisphaerae bacterium]|nr:Trehalose-6-phosphate synthase [Phycisphaerae bacterium]